MSFWTYIYSRVSSLVQYREGHGDEAQYGSCMQFAEELISQGKLPPLAPDKFWYSDQVSTKAGSKRARDFSQRPGGHSLELVLKKGDHLIVHSICRLGRSINDAMKTLICLEERGIIVHVSSQPGLDPTTTIGKIMLSLLVGFAQLDNDYRSERLKLAHAIGWLKGVRINGNYLRPGYRWKNKETHEVERDAREAALCGLFYQYRSYGMPVYRMFVIVKNLGVLRADNGKNWTIERVRNAIKHEVESLGALKVKRELTHDTLAREFMKRVRSLYSME